MLVPPPVSDQPFPSLVGDESRKNLLGLGFASSLAYDNNVLKGVGARPISDEIYSIAPTIYIQRTTARLNETFSYLPGFTFYENTSSLDEADETASGNFRIRPTQNTALSFQDLFERSSNAFNQSDLVIGNGIYGSALNGTSNVVVPFADRITNSASGQYAVQFNGNSMMGISGSFSLLDFPDPAQVVGLYNINAWGGAAFFNQRISSKQYIGASYDYTRLTEYAATGQGEIDTDTIYPFYTVYLAHAFSVSVSSGPQYYLTTQAPAPPIHAWTPYVTASAGWQRKTVNVALSFTRTVSGGGGLLGTFRSNNGGLNFRWQTSRMWTFAANFFYAGSTNLDLSLPASEKGGHSISGNAMFQHPLSEHMRTEVGYDYVRESYASILSLFPTSNREYVGISYQLTKPLGR
jgi:hypothetical protein